MLGLLLVLQSLSKNLKLLDSQPLGIIKNKALLFFQILNCF